jgi:hypothetical protein
MTCTYERIRVILGKLCCSYKYFIDKGAIIGFHLSIFFSAYPLLMFDFFLQKRLLYRYASQYQTVHTQPSCSLVDTIHIFTQIFISQFTYFDKFHHDHFIFFWVNGCMCYKDIYILLLIHWAIYQFHFNITTNLANKNCKLPSFLQFLTLTFSFFNFSVGFAGSHIASYTLFLSSAQKSFIKQTLDALR